MARGHAEALMPLIARVMDQAGIEFADLDRIAVTVGPGSFTGLRVGISAARGIALAAAKPRSACRRWRALRHPIIAEDDTTRGGGDRRPPWPCLPAGVRHQRPHAGRAAHRDHERCGAGGDDGTGPPRRLGRAAGRSAMADERTAAVSIEQRGAPDIEWIARLGAAAPTGYGPPKPLYLRAPDAQPQDAARLPRR